MAYQKVGTPRFYINLLEWMGLNKLYTKTNFPTDWEAGDYLRYRENEYKPTFTQNPSQWHSYSHNFPDLFRTYPRIRTAIDYFGINLVATTLMSPYQNILDHGDGGNSFIAFLAHEFGSLDKIKYALEATYNLHTEGTAAVYRSTYTPPSNEDDDGNPDENEHGVDITFEPMIYWMNELTAWQHEGQTVGAATYKGKVYPALNGWNANDEMLDENGEIMFFYQPGHDHEGADYEMGLAPLVKGRNHWVWLSEGVELLAEGVTGYGGPPNFGPDCNYYFNAWGGSADDPPYVGPNGQSFYAALDIELDYVQSWDTGWFQTPTYIKNARKHGPWDNILEAQPINQWPLSYGKYNNFIGDLTASRHGPSADNILGEMASGTYSDGGGVLTVVNRSQTTRSNGMFFHGYGLPGDFGNRDEFEPDYQDVELTELINASEEIPAYNGFSISTFNGIGVGGLKLRAEKAVSGGEAINITGSVVIGSYYDMPHSPELSLTMTREMDGVYKTRGKGGHDFTDHDFIKPKKWGVAGAWELHETGPASSGALFTEENVAMLDNWDMLGWDQVFIDNGYIFSPDQGPSAFLTTSAYDGSSFLTFYGGLDSNPPSNEDASSSNWLKVRTNTQYLTPGNLYRVRIKTSQIPYGVLIVFGDLDNTSCQHLLNYSDPDPFEDPVNGIYSHPTTPWIPAGPDGYLYLTVPDGPFNYCNLKEIELYEQSETFNMDPKIDLSKVGRRVWDLEFNYLSETDIFSDISSLSNFDTIGSDGTVFTEDPENHLSVSENTLTQDNTFFSQVLHKTNGGQLPFIFQPDNTNNNPDQFALAKFDMNTFKFEQVANGVYNIKVKIKEVW